MVQNSQKPTEKRKIKIPKEVKRLFKEFEEEESLLRKKQRRLGKKIPLNEKTIGCTCTIEHVCDLHGNKILAEADICCFSEPATFSRTEPIVFRTVKNDGSELANNDQNN